MMLRTKSDTKNVLVFEILFLILSLQKTNMNSKYEMTQARIQKQQVQVNLGDLLGFYLKKFTLYSVV